MLRLRHYIKLNEIRDKMLQSCNDEYQKASWKKWRTQRSWNTAAHSTFLRNVKIWLRTLIKCSCKTRIERRIVMLKDVFNYENASCRCNFRYDWIKWISISTWHSMKGFHDSLSMHQFRNWHLLTNVVQLTRDLPQELSIKEKSRNLLQSNRKEWFCSNVHTQSHLVSSFR